MAGTAQAEPWRALLEEGREDERLVRQAFEGARAPVLAPLPEDLHPTLLAGLRSAGIEELYAHQAAALDAAQGSPFVVTTGTASGKSLCFNIPTLHTLCTTATARALYLYPTKALAQDQARAIAAFRLGRAVRPAIYDGDTKREDRTAIRKRSNLILTNPDMLHMGILPNHAAWANFLTSLRVVVVDEAHVYRGVFGSHVGNVLRRLRRLVVEYSGEEPLILLASATIANPVELAEGLTGVEGYVHIAEDGSPGAARQIAMWNPPVTDEALQTRRSALGEAADMVRELVVAGARTICFVKSRKGVELVAKLVADQLGDAHPALRDRVAPYRAGYTPQQRREIEARLVSGDLLAVITTDALELGIDIGALDAAVVVTFPGTVASLRQMWGRAGRRGRGFAVYIAGEDALDQFFCRHPDEFLDRPVESAIINYENEQIHDPHLLCAAHERPLGAADEQFFGPRLRASCEHLEAQGHVIRRGAEFWLRKPEDYPAARVSLRSGSPDAFAVVDIQNGELLGSVDSARAFSTVHDGAVYLHLGRSYAVRELDVHGRRALVEPFSGDYYTQPKKETDTYIERLMDRRSTMGVTLSFGMVSVSETVIAYQRKRLPGHEPIDLVGLDLPETTFTTQALWYEPDPSLLAEDFPLELLLGTLHAVEHSQIAVLPLLAMCDRWDIGGLSTNIHPQTGGPTIFIYDGHPGGVGITHQGFIGFERLLGATREAIGACRCEQGCPSCVQSPKCGNLNDPLAKDGAAEMLRRMLDR